MHVGGIVAVLLTGINSIQDIRKKEIYFFVTVAVGVVGIIYSLANGVHLVSLAAAFVPALILVALSLLTKDHIGMGDAIIAFAIGCWCDLYYVAFVLLAALLFVSVFGMICFMRGKHKTELPFVPFVFAGCLLKTLLL